MKMNNARSKKFLSFGLKKRKRKEKYPYYAVDILLQTTRLMFRLKMF